MATNRHAKKAMINATMQHSRNAKESSIYLKKKISQGKKYQQAIRSLGRHLVRVIWSMIQQERNNWFFKVLNRRNVQTPNNKYKIKLRKRGRVTNIK